MSPPPPMSKSQLPTGCEPEPVDEAVRKARRGVLVKWLRKARKRRRTLSTLLMRGWSHR